VFAHPDLRRLQLAWAASNVGAWAYTIAIAVYAFREDGAFAVGVIALLRWVASGLASPAAGTLADRFPRVRVMVGSDLVRAVLLLAMAVLVAAGTAPVAVYAISIVGTVVGTAFRPAQAALVPALARDPEELVAANATASTIESVGLFVGPALGGLLVATTSVEATFVVGAALMVWSAAVIARVREPERAPRPAGAPRDVLAGFRALAAERRLALLTALFAAQTFVDGMLGVLVVVLALDTLDLGAGGVGTLNSALGIGGIVGGLAVAALITRGRLARDFALGLAAWGVPLLALAAWPQAAVALAALVVVGIGNTIVDVAGDTLLQRSVPEEVLGRAFAALETVILLSIAAGSMVAPVLLELAGARWTLAVTGALLPLLAVASWRGLVALDRPADDLVDVLRRLPLFAPLDEPTIEVLARRARRRDVAPGDVIVSAGDVGDSFYVVGSGTFEVTSDGAAPRFLVAGDFFGEIALLRAVPRTATVRATTEGELVVLEGHEFVRAVARDAEATRIADAVVGARLAAV
jgi:MFS family permease